MKLLQFFPVLRLLVKNLRRVAIFVCLCVCLWQFKTPSTGGRGDFWSKGVSLILGCDDHFFFSGFLILPTVSQPTVDDVGVSPPKKYFLTLVNKKINKWILNNLIFLPRPLKKILDKIYGIGATICIGWEIQCLLYAGFLF